MDKVRTFKVAIDCGYSMFQCPYCDSRNYHMANSGSSFPYGTRMCDQCGFSYDLPIDTNVHDTNVTNVHETRAIRK